MDSTAHRSTMLFEESIRSKYTKKNYASHLDSFMEFSGLDGAGLLSTPREQLQRLLEDYLIRLKREANPNSVPSKFQGIRHFCVMNRIYLDWEIIRKMFPQRLKSPSLRSYTTDEVSKMVHGAKNPRDAALIQFMASTGARIGVFDHELSMRHLKRMPHGCKAVRLYAGCVEEYWAFLTPQASEALDVYHDRQRQRQELHDGMPILATRNNACAQLGWSGARSAIYRLISKSGISRSMCGGRYDVQADHGFRKRFNTILKLDNSVNHNIAEKLMGHRNGLDGVYFTPTLEELFAEFRKVMHRIEA